MARRRVGGVGRLLGLRATFSGSAGNLSIGAPVTYFVSSVGLIIVQGSYLGAGDAIRARYESNPDSYTTLDA